MSRRREGAGGAGAIRAAVINWCGSFAIAGCCKYIRLRAGCVTRNNSWGMIPGYDSGV